jgi:hypothetical protein
MTRALPPSILPIAKIEATAREKLRAAGVTPRLVDRIVKSALEKALPCLTVSPSVRALDVAGVERAYAQKLAAAFGVIVQLQAQNVGLEILVHDERGARQAGELLDAIQGDG